MSEGLMFVARELLKEAERLNRWSKHWQTAEEREAVEGRVELARMKARAAFALVTATKFPAVGSGRDGEFQGLENSSGYVGGAGVEFPKTKGSDQ